MNLVVAPKTECTKGAPNPKASVHNGVVEYQKITVKAGLVQWLPMLKCLDCGLEVPES